VLLAAADALMLSDPQSSARLAARAVVEERSVRALIALAAAHAEAGDPAAARSRLTELQQLAVERPLTDREWLLSGFEDLSLALWSERSPASAAATLRRMRAEVRPGLEDELDSVEGLIMLFTGRPEAARSRADDVLGRDPSSNVAIRALTTRLGALSLTERSDDVLATVDRLLTELATTPVPATRYGLAHVLVALARLIHSHSVQLPVMAGASGRWPSPRSENPEAEPATWPLLAGVHHQQIGDQAAATVALREAFTQQIRGEGLFRSEAAACLVVALAESGRTAEARRILAQTPPDDVALIPGLRKWAEASVRGAAHPSIAAGCYAVAAAREAATAGAAPIGLVFLADAARFGAVRAAAEALPEFAACRSPLAAARIAGIRARAGNRPVALVEAAEANQAVLLLGHARQLATLARDRASAASLGEVRRRATRVLRTVAERLGESGSEPDTGLPRLTERESEIARLASTGLSDREIAASLVVSVRTVESHLASAYRKLGIVSRRNLRAALTGR
jgi:DNA-binding CsgD family transcriptional regulator